MLAYVKASCKYLTLCGDRFNICAAIVGHVAQNGEYYEPYIHTSEGISRRHHDSVSVNEEQNQVSYKVDISCIVNVKCGENCSALLSLS